MTRLAIPLIVCSLLTATGSLFAGDLNPPVGPVTPTHKTLTEVEPRTPLSQANVPIVINSRGSYYLTSSLIPTAGGQVAITINSSEVSLDLSGFTIANSASQGFSTGILVSGTRQSVSISNGVVRGATSNGINTSAAEGVALTDLRVNSCGNNGILTGVGAVLTRCVSSDNFSDGFETGASNTLSECIGSGNNGNGFNLGTANTARACGATGNIGRGFSAGSRVTIVGCSAENNGGIGISTGAACVVADCSAANNGAEAGIFLGNASTARSCTSQSNAGGGFDSTPAGLSSFVNCTALQNGTFGFNVSDSSSAMGCTSSFNATDGFSASADAVLTDCTSTFNEGEGYDTGSTCTLTRCTASNNASYGFDVGEATTLEGCTSRNNGDSGFNLGLSCRASACMSRDNDGAGFFTDENCTMNDCTAHSNNGGVQSGDGFMLAVGSSTHNCTATANADVGIESFGRNLIVGCVVRDNLGLGVRLSNAGSRVDSCLMHSNGAFDLRVDTSGNQVVRNRWTTHTIANFNAVGTIQNVTDGTNSHNDHPWANFDF